MTADPLVNRAAVLLQNYDPSLRDPHGYAEEFFRPLLAEARREGAAEALEKVASDIFDHGDARSLGVASVLRVHASAHRRASAVSGEPC